MGSGEAKEKHSLSDFSRTELRIFLLDLKANQKDAYHLVSSPTTIPR